LGRRFAAVQVWRQAVACGCVFRSTDTIPAGGSWYAMGLASIAPTSTELNEPWYLLAACSSDPAVLQPIARERPLFVDPSSWLLLHYRETNQQLIRQEAALKQELSKLSIHLAKVIVDNQAKQAEIDQAGRHIQHVERTLAEVQTHLDNHARRLRELEQELSRR
jgi:hypothetical protein